MASFSSGLILELVKIVPENGTQLLVHTGGFSSQRTDVSLREGAVLVEKQSSESFMAKRIMC